MIEKFIFSVVGFHAGSNLDFIFDYKSKDILKFGYTFWLQCSAAAIPSVVQDFCKNEKSVKCYFISTSGGGLANDTKTKKVARQYSEDTLNWKDFPTDFGPVVGNIGVTSNALVLKSLEKVNFEVNIGKYIMPRISLGCSTVCGIKDENLIFTNIRKVIAVAELTQPWCIYLRR